MITPKLVSSLSFRIFRQIVTEYVASFQKIVKLRVNVWFWGTPSLKPISLLFLRVVFHHITDFTTVSPNPN
jgi:hypothetical protein